MRVPSLLAQRLPRLLPHDQTSASIWSVSKRDVHLHSFSNAFSFIWIRCYARDIGYCAREQGIRHREQRNKPSQGKLLVDKVLRSSFRLSKSTTNYNHQLFLAVLVL